MPSPLNVVKIALGAFLIPWWNKRAFAKALAIPLVLVMALTLGRSYAGDSLSQPSKWAFSVAYSAFVTVFAVTCHRLVLLDPVAVASRITPRWSGRETRFFLWAMAISIISAAAMYVTAMSLLNASVLGAQSLNGTVVRCTAFFASLPGFYLLARLSLVLPATAVDRRVSLKWAWKITEKNGWRLVLLVGVLPWLISQAMGLLYRNDPSLAETIVVTLVGVALLAVEVAALSLSYHALTQDEKSQEFAG